MRILIITKYAWDEKIASGNTLSNFFENWADAEFFTVYCRDAIPNNKCCNVYFSISPINILKNLFTPWRIGREFRLENKRERAQENEAEKKLVKLSKSCKFFSFLYYFLYSTRLWLNRRIKLFLKTANPDIVFGFGVPDIFNYELIKYIKQNMKVPVITYFVDNHYSENVNFWNINKIRRNKRLSELSLMSDKCYAISQRMCDTYSSIMHMDFSLLTKGCYIREIRAKNNNPLRIVYAGNLYYGREKVLINLVSILKSINQAEKHKCYLDIYTVSQLSDDIKSKLNVDGNSSLHTPKPYEEIIKIQSESDIVLYVDSFDKEQIEKVKYSFSTKITDCLQSGSMVLAIGPSSIASIDFLKKVPGVVIVTDMLDLKPILQSLVSSPSSIFEKASETNVFAGNNMAIEGVRQRMQKDFVSLINKIIYDRS